MSLTKFVWCVDLRATLLRLYIVRLQFVLQRKDGMKVVDFSCQAAVVNNPVHFGRSIC